MQKSASHYTEAAWDEIEILRQVRRASRLRARSLARRKVSGADAWASQIRQGDPDNRCRVVTLLDSFEHSGPNGKHVCMVRPSSLRTPQASLRSAHSAHARPAVL